jgi:hypothetical protein
MGDTPWRVGSKVGRTVYDAHDRLIGVMDTPTLALLVVAAVNVMAEQKGDDHA